MKPAQRSAQAQADIVAALAYYQSEAPHMADNFLDALEKAVAHIQRAPGTGSPRYAHALDIPDLRFWLLGKFPYALFYLEHEDCLLVIRLVHMNRDIPVSLQDSGFQRVSGQTLSASPKPRQLGVKRNVGNGVLPNQRDYLWKNVIF